MDDYVIQHKLAPFVPIDRQIAYLRGHTISGRRKGAALFADISGFTSIFEQLQQQLGMRKSPELIAARLSHMFGLIVDQIHQYGGSVTNFSGDALTAWFEQTPPHCTQGEVAPGWLRAGACARSLQRLSQSPEVLDFPDLGTSFPLKLRLGVAAGQLHRLRVGDPLLRRFDLVAGAPMTQLGQMHKAKLSLPDGVPIALEEFSVEATLASKYHIEWGHPLHEAGGSYRRLCGIDLDTTMAPWPRPTPLPREPFSDWLPQSLRTQLQQHQGAWFASLRDVTTVFVQLGDLDFVADPDAAEKLDQIISDAQRLLASLGGHLMRVTDGDKGTYFYATFGAIEKHEDDAERGLHAAHQLKQYAARSSALGHVSIGVNKGLTWCGTYGSPHRHTYGVQGHAVNLAAKMMAQAPPQQIWLAGSLKPLTSMFAVAPLDDVESRPSQHMLQLLHRKRPEQGVPASNRFRHPLCGRTHHRQALWRWLSSLRQGLSYSWLALEGEAGIGKSHLLYDTLAQARHIGIYTTSASASHPSESTPYRPWHDLMSPLLSTLAAPRIDPDAPTARDALAAGLVSWCEQHMKAWLPQLPLLNELTQLALPPTELTKSLQGKLRHTQLRELVKALLATFARQRPLLLAIEDIHLLDDASLVLLDEILAASLPLHVLTTSRDSHHEQHRLQARPQEHLHLAPLTRSALDELLQTIAESRLPSAVLDWLWERSQGHPLFAIESLRGLLQEGILLIEGGIYRLSTDAFALEDVAPPTSVEGLFLSRFDRLSPVLQTWLKVASFFPRSFTVEMLGACIPSTPTALETQAQQLIEEGWISTLERGGYGYSHALARDAIYHAITFAQRRHTHAQIAAWYEQLINTEDAPPASALYTHLAHHWHQSENAPKARQYFDLAGEAALAVFANQEALRCFKAAAQWEVAISHDTRPPRSGTHTHGNADDRRMHKARRLHLMGQACYGHGDIPGALEHFRSALQLLGIPEPQKTPGLVVACLKEIALQYAHRHWPGRFLKRSTQPQLLLAEASSLYNALANCYYSLGSVFQALLGTLRSLNLAESAPQQDSLLNELSRGCAGAGAAVAGVLRNPTNAEGYFQRAEQYAEQGNARSALAYALMVKGLLNYVNGRHHLVEAPLSRSLETLEFIGDWGELHTTTKVCEDYTFNRGRWDEALQWACKRYDSAVAHKDTRSRIAALGTQSWLMLLRGHTQDAESLLQEAQGWLSEHNHPAERLTITAFTAAWHLANDEEAAAKQWLSAAAQQQDAPAVIDTLEGFTALSLVSLSLLENSSQRRLDKALLQLLRWSFRKLRLITSQFSYIHKPRLGYLRGRLDIIKGRRKWALIRWQRALFAAIDNGVVYDEALLWDALARYLPHDHPQRAQAKQRARALADQMGIANGYGLRPCSSDLLTVDHCAGAQPATKRHQTEQRHEEQEAAPHSDAHLQGTTGQPKASAGQQRAS